MRRPVGWLALAVAVSGALFYVIRATEFGLVWTSWTNPVPEALLLALPGYLTLLGMVAPAIPISLLLHRSRVGLRPLRIAALGAGAIGVLLFLVVAVAAYDRMWSDYIGPFGLDVPARQPILPHEVTVVTGTLGPAFMGAWIALTSLQLRTLGISRALVGLGAITGLAIVASLPYGWDPFVYRTLLPAELVASLVWAAGVALTLLAGGSRAPKLAAAG
jgi:hypothetical protein